MNIKRENTFYFRYYPYFITEKSSNMTDANNHSTPTNPLPDDDKKRNNPLDPSVTNPEFTDQEKKGGKPSSTDPLPDTDTYRRTPDEPKPGIDPGYTDEDGDEPDSKDPLPDTDPYRRKPGERPDGDPEFTDEELSDKGGEIDPTEPLPDENPAPKVYWVSTLSKQPNTGILLVWKSVNFN